MNHNAVTKRLSSLRDIMKQRDIAAYIIPTTDPHMSEYPADCWKYREWISGFTGSAGTVVITTDKAGLWTDSRYFLQAATQLEGTGIELYRLMLPDTPSISNFLIDNIRPGQTVALNGETYSISDTRALGESLSAHGIKLDTAQSLIDMIWADRPALPDNKVMEMPLETSGKSTPEKIDEINAIAMRRGAQGTILSALDEVAWTFNIRSSDVAYNPVAVAYAFVSPAETVLFINPEKLTDRASERLRADDVKTLPYNQFHDYLSKLPDSYRKVTLDCAHTNTGIRNALPAGCAVVDGISPANHLKSIKNPTEIEGFRNAVTKDGIAMTRFYIWLERMLADGRRVTELSAAAKLTGLRSAQPGYIMDSFATISSYGPHGAVVHYSPTPETDTELGRDSLYLLDSGAQYIDGTTDITRTIALCPEPTPQMKADFTCALKGTIGIAMCKFPAGIRGCLIDAFARKALWDAGINYLHGTCHGIGHCLNVHEGPQSIRMEENPVILEAGMVMSDEPAMYRTGQYGIRTENMVLIKEVDQTEYGKFLGFETLTLCFIDTRLIDKSALTQTEIEWINRYHNHVFDRLSPHLTAEERAWLRKKTESI